MVSFPFQTVDDLGLQGCVALSALLMAQEHRLPVAPTRRMTVATMLRLRDIGIIQVPWPEALWLAVPDAEETPIEHLQWKLTWSAYERCRLREALAEYLDQFPRDDHCLGLRLALWSDLVDSEAERFFGQQLAKHRFDIAWAADITFVLKALRHLCLSASQWRYCGWAATRKGASVAQQFGQHSDAVRESIYSELRKRAVNVSSGTWNCALPPGNPVPESGLGRCFTGHLAKLGYIYWNEAPNAEALGGWKEWR
jgi:hypothetical protein